MNKWSSAFALAVLLSIIGVFHAALAYGQDRAAMPTNNASLGKAEFESSAPAAKITNTPPSASETGKVTYTLRRPQNPTAEQQKIYDQIDKSMQAAVGYYNRYTKLQKRVSLIYSPGTPTADGNINGTIRVGGSRNTRTLLHELGHVMGVGQDGNWNKLLVNGRWQGKEANKLLQEFTHDPQAQLHGDRMHFWPYGLNYDSEVKSEEDFIRHARLVEAIVKDLQTAKAQGQSSR